MRRGALALGIALACALPAMGAAADPRPLDLWPFVVRDARPVAGLESTRIGGPFHERWRTTPGPAGEAPRWDSIWTLRPLVAELEGPERRDLELLHPIAQWRWRPDRTRMRVTPFLDRTFETEAGPGSEGDRWTFLLAFGGRTDGGERYGGFFPFGGVAKERFGRERIDFWLFPLFGRSRDHRGFVRTHVLWPFFSWGRGGGRELLRVWPFYGHDKREGEWDRRFALWPFVHWRTEKPGGPAERKIRLVLPLWGESRSEHARSRFVLGPVYMDSANERTGATSLDLVWPLFRTARTPAREGYAGSRELKVEPFFRRRQGPGYDRTGSLFGAFDALRLQEGDLAAESLRVLYLNRFERRSDRATGETRLRRDVWPLFSQRERTWRDEAGAEHATGKLLAPWVLPLSGEPFQRNAAGLFTLYERRFADDESRTDWLWGLARSREAEGYRLDAVSWLFRRETGAASREGWRVLGIPLP